MAGQDETKKFFDAIKHPDKYETGVISRSGGKKKSIGYGEVWKQSVNRDRTVLESDGTVKRYVWDTAIATYDPEKGAIDFDTGGWETKLTKERMNQVLQKAGKKIHQDDFDWYVNDKEFKEDYSLPIEEFGIKRKDRDHKKTKKVS